MTNPWDQRFSRSSDYLYGEAPNAWIAAALPQLPVGAQVLALADGEGRNAIWLAEQGYQVTNCDYSQIGLAKTQQLAAQRGVVVTTQYADLTACTLPEAQFDAVVASFFHLPHTQQALVWENVIRAIKPSGYLIVQVFSREQLPLNSGGPKDESLLYQLSDWQHFLRTMHIEVLEATQVMLDEGKLHQGVANVINIKSIKRNSATMNIDNFWQSQTASALAVLVAIQQNQQLKAQFIEFVQLCETALRRGNKLLFAGNGGSAADAQHLAAELVVRFKRDRPGLPALALTVDSSVLTAIGNDYGFDQLFSRQVQALGQKGDVLIALSTSGNSTNILTAVPVAQAAGIHVIGMTGANGGMLAQTADLCLRMPSDDTPRVQEAHTLLGHILCDLLEENMFSTIQ